MGASPVAAPTLVAERLAIVREITCQRVVVGPEADPRAPWFYVWDWGDRIGPCDDPAAAARMVAAVLGGRRLL